MRKISNIPLNGYIKPQLMYVNKRQKQRAKVGADPANFEASMSKHSVVIIGNGMVGHRFIEELIDKAAPEQFAITVFCEEPRVADQPGGGYAS